MNKIYVILIFLGFCKAEFDGYCAPYHGTICNSYLNNSGLVWFNVAFDGTSMAGGWLNEKITIDLWEEVITGLKEPCRSAAEVHILLILLTILFCCRL